MRKYFVPNMNVDASKIHFKNVLSFDENGNLIVTIDGISKTFTPKE